MNGIARGQAALPLQLPDRPRPAADLRPSQVDMSQAEGILLKLADHIYTHSRLKPMSKVLFLISRCLLVIGKKALVGSAGELINRYRDIQEALGANRLADDYSFEAVVGECGGDIDRILLSLSKVREFARGEDSLGLAFNTLLRGKFESGEGLGTFLTPEEIVRPMVEMLLAAVDPDTLMRLYGHGSELLFGDICGGTGRFVYGLHAALDRASPIGRLSGSAARLFDQSSFAVDLCRINFLLEDLTPPFRCVADSLTDHDVTALAGRFALLATNPPFGIGKYSWSPALEESLGPAMLRQLGIASPGASCDPAELFLYRNLDLLITGGALAIVLPDGLARSRRTVETLQLYEVTRGVALEVSAVISLPVTAFALGGTVAKTSFAIIRKLPLKSRGSAVFFASAKHIGFLKKGNRRSPDPHGNELQGIAIQFRERNVTQGGGYDWRQLKRLVPSAPRSTTSESQGDEHHPARQVLRNLVDEVRERDNSSRVATREHFHVSVLDVDVTGLIDVVTASSNRPLTPARRCRPGDILLSCINPRIWRVTSIPELDVDWSCSPEFLVLRPRNQDQSWPIMLGLHTADVMSAVQSAAAGTSSSRQRVEKAQILEVSIPMDPEVGALVERHRATRLLIYETRLKEAALYARIHAGKPAIEY